MENSSMSIIENLYNGKINPIEEAIPQDENYRPLTKQIADERAYFESRLPAEDRERFEYWNKLIFEYEKMTEYANFSYGLKQGIMFATEVYKDEDCEL